jgi:hypothetical protein
MKKFISLSSLLIIFFFTHCTKDEDQVDTEKPSIDFSINGAFPVNCDTLYYGEPLTLRIRVTDNLELANFNLDIHHNFDHHSHSNEPGDCEEDPIKDPVNPFVLIESFSIPSGQTDYIIQEVIPLPESPDANPLDEGDYHFFINLTDVTGWSTQSGIAIKIFKRP